MKVYTLKEAARHSKIGMESLRRAFEEGLVKASRLPNRQWLVTESALEEALNSGIELPKAPKKSRGKRPMPEGLRRALDKKKKAKQENQAA